MSTLIFFLVLGGGFLHATWNFVSKKTGGNIVVFWFGFGIAALLYTPLALYFVEPEIISKKTFLYLLVSGTLMTGYFWGLSKAYQRGEISYCYPILRGIGIGGTALFAPFVLGQYPSLSGILGILSICGGILLISFPDNKNVLSSEGLGYAIFTGSMIIGYSLLDSKAVQFLHPFPYQVGYTFVSVFFLTPFVLALDRAEVKYAWKRWKWQGIFIGLSSMSVYMVILYAFQFGVTSYVVALRDTSIAFGAPLGFLFLRERFTLRKFWGIFMIFLGAIFIKLA